MFRPSRDDFRGVEIWANFFWEDSNLTARRLSCGGYLFTFSSQALACQVLQDPKSAIFKGATQCLHAWSPLEGSFRRKKVWLKLLHVPLHAWSPTTFGRIDESFGNLISIRWKSLETLPLGSVLLLVEVLDPKCIPPCVWIELDNLFYPISLAWIEASPPSDNLVAGSPHSLPETSSSFSWSVVSKKSGLAKQHLRWNPHDLFPGQSVYRPSFLASQWSSGHPCSLRIPRDTLPLLSGDDGDGDEVVEDIHSLRPLAFFKARPSLVGAENRALVADPIHEGRNSLDKGTPAALTSPPSIASAAGGILSYDTLLSAQETLPSLPLPLGLSTQHPPDGLLMLSSPHSFPTLKIHPGLLSQEPLASIQSTPPYRSSLGLSEEALPLLRSPSILSLTFVPFPFFCHNDSSLFASFLPVEMDPSLLLFGIITVHSLHPSPPDPAHLSELLGPCLPQPSLLIHLDRITTVLFPYEFPPSSPLNLGPQLFPFHFLSFYTPPSLLLPLSLSGSLPSLQLHLGSLLVLHPLLLPPWLTILQCLPWFRRLFLASGNLSSCRLSFFPLFPLDSPPPPLNLQ
ncbi:hypothetical protein AMTRI_Chr04g247760 [Amborella trichopoda]